MNVVNTKRMMNERTIYVILDLSMNEGITARAIFTCNLLNDAQFTKYYRR